MDGSFFSLYIAGAHCSGVEGTRAVSSAKMDQSLPSLSLLLLLLLLGPCKLSKQTPGTHIRQHCCINPVKERAVPLSLLIPLKQTSSFSVPMAAADCISNCTFPFPFNWSTWVNNFRRHFNPIGYNNKLPINREKSKFFQWHTFKKKSKLQWLKDEGNEKEEEERETRLSIYPWERETETKAKAQRRELPSTFPPLSLHNQECTHQRSLKEFL